MNPEPRCSYCCYKIRKMKNDLLNPKFHNTCLHRYNMMVALEQLSMLKSNTKYDYYDTGTDSEDDYFISADYYSDSCSYDDSNELNTEEMILCVEEFINIDSPSLLSTDDELDFTQ